MVEQIRLVDTAEGKREGSLAGVSNSILSLFKIHECCLQLFSIPLAQNSINSLV